MSVSSKPDYFLWDDREHVTAGEIWDSVVDIARYRPYLAVEFIDDYGTYLERCNPGVDGRWIAKQNIGYHAGYHEEEIRQLVYEVFECAHPILGTRKNVTPEEAFQAGAEWAKGWKKDDPDR